MRVKIFRLLSVVLGPVLSGFLLVLAFPKYDLGWLGWVALVPLLATICGRSAKCGFFVSFISGLIFWPGVFNWILQVPGYTFLHHAILGLYLGAYFGFFGLAFAFISRRWGVAPALLTAPFLWVTLEFVRSNLGFLALPWALLAHSQYQYQPIIQIASLSGTYGISFLIVLVNSALVAMVSPVLHRLQKTGPHLLYQAASKRGRTALALTAALFATLTFLYGYMTVSRPIVGKGIKVSVVQGNIEQSKKWDRKYAKFIMNTYADLTQEASRDHPALIIWPEAATPRSIIRDRRLYAQIRTIAKSAGTYILLGSTHFQKIRGKRPKGVKYRNSAFLINPDGRAKNQRYNKIRLLPFGEYLPMKETIPWSYINVPNIGSFTPGEKFIVFQCPTFRFGVTICWETLFPGVVREFAKKGAQFMVHITNEAWFAKTAATSYQLLAMSVFRAVENRVFLVRCANTGVSCFIDPYGRIVDRVKDSMGRDIFVRGVLSGRAIPLESKTFYTRYGDWLAWLSLPCSVGFLLVAFLRKNPGPHFVRKNEN